MVNVALLSAAALAGTASLVAAHPMNLNPFTPGGDTIAMGVKHPARSVEPVKGSLALKATLPVTNPLTGEDVDMEQLGGVLNKTTTQAKLQRLKGTEDREATEQSSTDLKRLEAHFKKSMVINYKELSQYAKGAAENAPWPSSYWPIYEDGINHVWNKEDSMAPSEKYARAYGLDPKAFTDKISAVNGIVSQTGRPKCKTNADCTSLKDGSSCGKRKGEEEGVCIPTWFGICHAWAPAAIEEREPRCAVTKGNITFQPLDIKALITQAYDGSHLSTVFTGTRFNGADYPENLDQDGRFLDATRRDVSPGFFHIAVLNIMGINKKSFIIDSSAGVEVWNQPVRSYEIISTTELTPAQAAETFFAPRTEYVFNKDATKIIFIQMKFNWIVESYENGPLVSTGNVDQYTQTVYYEYVLELNDAHDILGGEWVRNSRKEHPDFLWFPAAQPDINSVADVGIRYKDVRELVDASADCKELPSADSSAPPASSMPPKPSSSAPASSASGSKGGSVGGDDDSVDVGDDDGSVGVNSGSVDVGEDDGSVDVGDDDGSVGADDDSAEVGDEGDETLPVIPSIPPKPVTPKPSTKTPAGPTPSPKSVPPPAPVPSPKPDAEGKPGKGSVAPLVPAPATTSPSSKKPSGKPNADAKPTPSASSNDGSAANDATPAPKSSHSSKCRAAP